MRSVFDQAAGQPSAAACNRASLGVQAGQQRRKANPPTLMVAAAAAAAGAPAAAGMQQGADQAPARCGSSASATPQATQPTDTQHKAANARAAASSCTVKLAAGSKSVTAGGGGLTAAAAAASAAFMAAKLGLGDQLESALVKTPGLACLRDAEGRCCLHYAAGYGHEVSAASPAARLSPRSFRARPACCTCMFCCWHPRASPLGWAVVWCCACLVLQECVDMLLDKGGSEMVRARDSRGDLALHMAAQQGHPMCTYNLAKVGSGFPSMNSWGLEQRTGLF